MKSQPNHELEFHSLLAMFATQSKVNLSQVMLRVYDRAVEPFGYERACVALEKIAQEIKNWQMPTPQQLIEKMESRPSKISLANEIAGKIFEAVDKFGWSNSQGAKSFVGDIGWKVVNSFGGWMTICESSKDHGQMRAQMRDMALGFMDISEKAEMAEEFAHLSYEEKPQLNSAVKILANAKAMPK